MTTISNSKPKGIEISKSGPKKGVKINKGKGGRKGSREWGDESPPLTSSIQENFRGFTYHGEDAGDLISAAIGKLRGRNGTEEAVHDDDDEWQEPTTEDEVENNTKAAGRYAGNRRRGQLDDF